MPSGLEIPALERDSTPFEDLLPALVRLDRRLALAVDRARLAFGTDAASAPFRGLFISDRDVDLMLAREPGTSAFHASDLESGVVAEALGDDGADAKCSNGVVFGSRLAWLADTFALSPFDVDALVIALAPALDLRYERLYAFLQDDVSRRRPTLDLVLTLLCGSPSDRATSRRHFSADAPLVRRHLLHFGTDAAAVQSPLAEWVTVDEQVVNFLLGHDVLDRRLARFCRLEPCESSARALPGALEEADWHALRDAVLRAYAAGDALRLVFRGVDANAHRFTAQQLAAACGAPLLTIDASRLAPLADLSTLFGIALRDAELRRAVTVVSEASAMSADIADMLVEQRGIVVLSATSAPPSATLTNGALVVPFGIPSLPRRRAWWGHALAQCSRTAREEVLDTLAARFRLMPGQIDGAVAQASVRERLLEEHATNAPGELSAESLFAAARAQCGLELESLASRTTPRHEWADLVLPDDAMQQLHEMCDRIAHRELVVESWGFGRRLARGGGVNALFSGPSGTGKTMAAEVMAAALGVDLFRIDLAGVVSKYIGETEKNLDRVFAAAEHANGIVFFDEADALFGKRSEVHDSHDRYANIEISYLLQKMEAFDGVAILATNLRGNLDDAFVRRLAFAVHFPFPDAALRERIWRGIWPPGAPVDHAIDPALLARQFALSGGHIKNIALAAAFHAAKRGDSVELIDVLHAVRREYQKLGRTVTDVELSPFGEPPRQGTASPGL